MDKCRQVCPYNTLDGCKVKERAGVCPLTNIAPPITEYRMTNADRIRAMSDEELAELIVARIKNIHDEDMREIAYPAWLEWLQQPAKGE